MPHLKLTRRPRSGLKFSKFSGKKCLGMVLDFEYLVVYANHNQWSQNSHVGYTNTNIIPSICKPIPIIDEMTRITRRYSNLEKTIPIHTDLKIGILWLVLNSNGSKNFHYKYIYTSHCALQQRLYGVFLEPPLTAGKERYLCTHKGYICGLEYQHFLGF